MVSSKRRQRGQVLAGGTNPKLSQGLPGFGVSRLATNVTWRFPTGTLLIGEQTRAQGSLAESFIISVFQEWSGYRSCHLIVPFPAPRAMSMVQASWQP